jgi:hypothetical protein
MWWFILSFNIAVRDIDATHGLGHNEFVVNMLEAAISGKTSNAILKQVARNTIADSYTAIKMGCNKSRWKAASQSKD